MSVILMLICALVFNVAGAFTQNKPKQGKVMTNRASGTFEVKLNPQDQGEDMPVGRMSIDKQFQGDLAGTSKGQMLMASSSSVKNSAGYVAIEKVTGTLNGRRGSFYLQHNATMTRGRRAQHHRHSRFRHGRTHRAERKDEHHHRRGQTLVRV